MELIGRTFGHIRISDVAGGGGMGAVYVGHDEKLDRRVAVKVLHAERRLEAEPRERLLREARALSKLDHPNICRIYDYIDSDEIDLLVLEYIDGETLQAVLHKRSLTRGEKLDIAIAVAEVLCAAHRLNILHRDLKPENVMIATNGEIKVLDFGLARWLDVLSGKLRSSGTMRAVGDAVDEDSDDVWFPFTADSPTEPRYGSPRQPFQGTVMGVAVGTPLYMSPEQARGEELTTASDMFSFGLLLQTLFSGVEPQPKELRGRKIISRVAKGVTLPVQGVESGIAALIERLKQLAPSDRPTAVETLAELRSVAGKRTRILRRCAAAAAALVVILGVAWHIAQLSRARAIAEQHRLEAENLIEFMLGDLRKKLEPVGRLDILDDVDQRALKYVEALEPETMTGDQLARNAKALSQLGEVRARQGKLREALDVFQRSLVLAELAAKRDPSSAKMQLAVATGHFWVGDLQRQQRMHDDALRHYATYLQIAEALSIGDPRNDEYRLETAYGHSSVAAIYELQGDYARALGHLRLTREVKESRLAERPADADRQGDLARTINRIGYVLERSGDLHGAREHYQHELAMYSNLVRDDPRNSRWKDRLFISHNFLARILEVTGDIAGALDHRRNELALIEELTRRDPQNVQWQRNLAITQFKYGEVLRMRGDVSAALLSIASAEKTLQRLLARPETLDQWRRDLAIVHTASARAHLANGDAASAERAAAASIREFEALTTTDSTTPRYTADAYLVLGDAEAASGRASKAREAWSRAAAILPLKASETPEARDISVRALIRLQRRDEAAPVIEQLQRIGYRAPDFLSAIS